MQTMAASARNGSKITVTTFISKLAWSIILNREASVALGETAPLILCIAKINPKYGNVPPDFIIKKTK
jgi:hypothetical protein